MITEQERIIRKFEAMSLKYHKLSLLFNELGHSLNIKMKKERINPNSKKELKEFLKGEGLDFDKLRGLVVEDLSLLDLKGGIKE